MIRTLALIACVAGYVQTLNAAEVSHPVYPSNATEASVPSLEGSVQHVMAMTDDEVRQFVPKVNGILFCGCPNCDKGTQEGQIAWKGIEDPDKAVCRYCSCEYPNPKYPENKTKTGTNFKGEKITYTFYEDADGTEYMFTGRINYEKKHWLASQAHTLARLYDVTRDEKYAHKTVVVLDALAEAYSHWCAHYDWPFRKKGPVKPEPPFSTAGGMWNRWFYADVPLEALWAYDLVAASGAVQKLSDQLGVDVKKRIEDDFFRFSVWFVRTYEENFSNMSPGIYQGLIVAGRVLGEPGYVHDGVNRFKNLLARKFFRDGFWSEGSISYHDQTIYWLERVADTVTGYSDPEGYTCPDDGERYDDLDIMAQFPLAKVALAMNQRYVYPDGHIVPTHDAWARSSRGALDRSEPWILPAMGHAILGCGDSDQQTQAHLHFSGGYGHQHADSLHFGLWSNGHELLPDIGYTHTRYRAWTVATPAHNTVAVDEQTQNASGHTCNLTLWEPKAGPAQVVEAEATAAYPGATQDYRRMLALIPVDEGHSYVLDVFRVEGGTKHDYFLHGSADVEQNAECSVALSPGPESLLGEGVEFSLPTLGEQDNGKVPPGKTIGYGFIQDLKVGSSDDSFDVTFRSANGEAASYTGTILGYPGTGIALGQAPSIRRAGEDDTKLDDAKMQVLAVRRSGDAGLQSTFATIHRGWEGEDFIKSVKPVALSAASSGAVALVVEHHAGRDFLVSCAPGKPGAFGRDGKLSCNGRFGLIRYDTEGNLVAAALVGGTLLSMGDVQLDCGGSLTGTLLGVRRPDDPTGQFAFEVGEKLPDGEALSGRMMIVSHPDGRAQGYEIAAVEQAGEGSLVWLDSDPGFEIEDGTTRFLAFPQGEVEGSNTYVIESLVAITRD